MIDGYDVDIQPLAFLHVCESGVDICRIFARQLDRVLDIIKMSSLIVYSHISFWTLAGSQLPEYQYK